MRKLFAVRLCEDSNRSNQLIK